MSRAKLQRHISHADPIVWDNHACPPMKVEDLDSHLPKLKRFHASGVDMLSLNVGYGEMQLSEHFAVIDHIRGWIAQRSDELLLVSTVADIETAKETGRLAISFDIEGVRPFEGDLSLVERFHEAGVKWILLAYNLNNWAAGGVHGQAQSLTEAGAALINKMQQTGIIVCLSHTAQQTAEDVFSITEKPVIFSHSNPKQLRAHPRNISDRLIDSCAKTGGVIGINGLALFLGEGGATAANVVRHIEYIADRVGVDHVGLGLDYVFDLEGLEEEKAQMKSTFPPGAGYEAPTVCTPPEAIPDIAEGLLAKNWREADISAVLGGNWLRVARQCW